MHGPRPYLDVVRLLNDATAISPVSLEIEDEGLQVHGASEACHTSGKYTMKAALCRDFLNWTDNPTQERFSRRHGGRHPNEQLTGCRRSPIARIIRKNGGPKPAVCC